MYGVHDNSSPIDEHSMSERRYILYTLPCTLYPSISHCDGQSMQTVLDVYSQGHVVFNHQLKEMMQTEYRIKRTGTTQLRIKEQWGLSTQYSNCEINSHSNKGEKCCYFANRVGGRQPTDSSLQLSRLGSRYNLRGRLHKPY